MARKGLPLRGDTLPLVGRLWREWMRPHARSLAIVLALIAVVAAATGLYPILIKAAFEAFTNKDERAIMMAPLFIVAVTSVKGFALLGLTVMTNRVVTRIEADMQAALFAHLIDADLAQLGRDSAASLTQRFTTDFAFIKEALTRLSTVFLREVATIAALVVAMVWIDPVLTLGAAVTVPFIAHPIGRIGQKLRRVATSTQEQIGAMAAFITESLQGIRVAKTYGLEGYLKARARGAFDEVRRLRMKAANARARLDPLLEIGAGIAAGGVLILIGWRILDGRSTVGDFTGFVTALMLAAQPIRALGNLNAVVQEAVAALTRYFGILDEVPRIGERPSAPALAVGSGEIRFEDVGFRYGDDIAALDGINLVAAGGRTTALVGRSGSGKSTLLSLVPRLYDVTRGAVRIDGQDVRDVTLRSLRSHVAVVSQDVVLFNDTIRSNIAFGREVTASSIEEAARAAYVMEFVRELPSGLDTIVGDRGVLLSGGQRQRIAIARALLKNAPILILDEATSALDTEAERIIQRALEDLMQNRTTLVIAHRLSTVEKADRIFVLDGGHVVESGSHAELIQRNGQYAALHRMQFNA